MMEHKLGKEVSDAYECWLLREWTYEFVAQVALPARENPPAMDGSRRFEVTSELDAGSHACVWEGRRLFVGILAATGFSVLGSVQTHKSVPNDHVQQLQDAAIASMK